MIDAAHVDYIADLARLNLSAGEREAFTRQLGTILEYMEQLNTVDTAAVEPTCFVAPEHDPMRGDVERASLAKAALLQNGPSVKRGFFAIPKVIGD